MNGGRGAMKPSISPRSSSCEMVLPSGALSIFISFCRSMLIFSARRVDHVDRDRAVDQRPHPIVVADRDGKLELGHGGDQGSGNRDQTREPQNLPHLALLFLIPDS